MRVDRKLLLKILIGVGGALVGVAILTPVGDFFVEYWRSRGVYDDPQAVVNAVAGFFSFTTQLWFQLLAVGILAFGAGMWADDRWRRVELGKSKPLTPDELKAFGASLTDLATEMFKFLADRTSELYARHREVGTGKDTSFDWQADRDFDQITGAKFMAIYHDRALAALLQIRELGIQLPHHMLHLATSGRPQGIPKFLSIMGVALRNGQLERAIALSNDQTLMHQISI